MRPRQQTPQLTTPFFVIHKKRREALHCCSLHILRLWYAIVVETSNAEAPRRYVHHTTTMPTKTNGIEIHQWLYGTMRHVYNIPTKDIHVALSLTTNEIYQISGCQNQSVVNAFYYVLPHAHPCHRGHFRRRTIQS